MASDRWVILSPDGPFDTPAAYYTAWAEQYMSLIADGQLYTNYPVDAYLVHRFLKDSVGRLTGLKEKGNTDPAKKFFLKHVDDKGDHLLVDVKAKPSGGLRPALTPTPGTVRWQRAGRRPKGDSQFRSLRSQGIAAPDERSGSWRWEQVTATGIKNCW